MWDWTLRLELAPLRASQEIKGLEVAEVATESIRSGGVVKHDRDVFGRERVELVPAAGDEEDGIPDLRVMDVRHHASEYHYTLDPKFRGKLCVNRSTISKLHL
ncbi:hypothetical protein TorRG33x02_035460 [Trema orientale]|uniref:Uncharacterized protein n=1 Tax=Trema orientale TaxID=63057 RepID=A0A2P5FSZ0_TREOI|nr:hypothetical protein TorRG33x02_035460 [Trema orientale]